MPKLIRAAMRIQAAGNRPKVIDEYVGRLNTGDTAVSIAHMRSPEGWEEPGQRPTFAEHTIVLRGTLRVEHRDGVIDVSAGQAIQTEPGEWVRYSSPHPGGAEYVAVCVPAFADDEVNRD